MNKEKINLALSLIVFGLLIRNLSLMNQVKELKEQK